MGIKPYSWEQRGFVSWGQEVSSPASLVCLEKLVTMALHSILFPRTTSMPDMAVHGKNKGSPAEHRHITHQETCYLTPIPVYCIRKGMRKRYLRICPKKSLSQLCPKQTLGKRAAWVPPSTESTARPTSHESVSLHMI